MKVLVTGGRDFDRAGVVSGVLDVLHQKHGFTHVIQGDATGADSLAADWAASEGIQPVTCWPLWRFYGKAAGAIRNQRMLELAPDMVVAFPGGVGTAHMVRIARKAGIKVHEVQRLA